MTIVTATNPVVLYGVKSELNDSPRLTIDSGGATLTHEYRLPAVVNPSLQVQDLPDPVAMLNPPFNLTRGAYHWKRTLGGLYAQVRLSSFDWSRASDHNKRATLRLTFAYNYPLTMNDYGETWRYSLATETTEIKSVTTKSRRMTYGIDYSGNIDTAIGVDGETVHGAQALRPSTALRVTKIWSGAPTQSALDTISELRAHVNDRSFPNTNEWQPREVLFTGAEVQQNADGYWQVDYDFLCAKKLPTQTIELISGDDMVNINPDPWDHVDYEYASAFDSGAGDEKIRTAPISVSVSQIYEIGNLDRLGLVGGVFA